MSEKEKMPEREIKNKGEREINDCWISGCDTWNQVYGRGDCTNQNITNAFTPEQNIRIASRGVFRGGVKM